MRECEIVFENESDCDDVVLVFVSICFILCECFWVCM